MIQSLRASMTEDARPELDAVLRDFAGVNVEGHPDEAIGHRTLLISAVRSGQAWLVQRIVNGMSQAMEIRWPSLPSTINPLGYTCDYKDKLAGKRPDRSEVDALAMGHGSSGSNDVADNVFAHCRAWNAFQQGDARKVINVRSSHSQILMKYLAAGKAWMIAAKHYTLPNDGFRVGGKELLMGTIMARVDGNVKAMWCMPQVLMFK